MPPKPKSAKLPKVIFKVSECTIVLPVLDSAKKALVDAHTDMIEELVSKFGSVRALSCVQFIQAENGKFQDLDVHEYKFPVLSNKAQEQIDIAKKYAVMCGIKSVYVVLPSGIAQFIDV